MGSMENVLSCSSLVCRHTLLLLLHRAVCVKGVVGRIGRCFPLTWIYCRAVQITEHGLGMAPLAWQNQADSPTKLQINMLKHKNISDKRAEAKNISDKHVKA